MTRDDVLRQYATPPFSASSLTDSLADEIVRLRSILSALREPSEKVLLAAVEAVPYGASYAALTRCIPAAVAAAEKEVANGHV